MYSWPVGRDGSRELWCCRCRTLCAYPLLMRSIELHCCCIWGSSSAAFNRERGWYEGQWEEVNEHPLSFAVSSVPTGKKDTTSNQINAKLIVTIFTNSVSCVPSWYGSLSGIYWKIKNPQPNKPPTNSTSESLCNLYYSDELLLSSSTNWNYSDFVKFHTMYSFSIALFCLILSPSERKKISRNFL